MADQRDPDTIQREIERTRAELADTIDAIADRVSPRRAAARGVGAVRHAVSGHKAPASVLDAPHGGGAGPKAIESAGSHTSEWTGTAEYAVRRRLRADRVLIAVGVVSAVAAVVVLRRARS